MISGCECVKCFLAWRFHALALVFHLSSWGILLTLVPSISCGSQRRWHLRANLRIHGLSQQCQHTPGAGGITELSAARIQGVPKGSSLTHGPWAPWKPEQVWPGGSESHLLQGKVASLQPGFTYPHGLWVGTLPLLIMMRPSRTGILITRELKHSQVLNTWEQKACEHEQG